MGKVHRHPLVRRQYSDCFIIADRLRESKMEGCPEKSKNNDERRPRLTHNGENKGHNACGTWLL